MNAWFIAITVQMSWIHVPHCNEDNSSKHTRNSQWVKYELMYMIHVPWVTCNWLLWKGLRMIWSANKRSSTKLPYNLCEYFFYFQHKTIFVAYRICAPYITCEYSTAKDHSCLTPLNMFSLKLISLYLYS